MLLQNNQEFKMFLNQNYVNATAVNQSSKNSWKSQVFKKKEDAHRFLDLCVEFCCDTIDKGSVPKLKLKWGGVTQNQILIQRWWNILDLKYCF